jgi:hypothetical protein
VGGGVVRAVRSLAAPGGASFAYVYTELCFIVAVLLRFLFAERRDCCRRGCCHRRQQRGPDRLAVRPPRVLVHQVQGLAQHAKQRAA